MAEIAVLDQSVVEDTLFGENTEARMDSAPDPGPDDWCFCTCRCTDATDKASIAGAVSATLSVQSPQP